MAELPPWATEPIEIVSPDPAWAIRGGHEIARLRQVLDRWLIGEIEHVGSTAVPGLAAKPIIDLQACAPSLHCAPEIARALSDDGWHLVPSRLDGRPSRRMFIQVSEAAVARICI